MVARDNNYFTGMVRYVRRSTLDSSTLAIFYGNLLGRVRSSVLHFDYCDHAGNESLLLLPCRSRRLYVDLFLISDSQGDLPYHYLRYCVEILTCLQCYHITQVSTMTATRQSPNERARLPEGGSVIMGFPVACVSVVGGLVGVGVKSVQSLPAVSRGVSMPPSSSHVGLGVSTSFVKTFLNHLR
jgi:hypothetical protein